LELTTFESPLVSRIYRSSPKPLPRIYIKKESLEHGGRIIYRYMLPKFRGASPSTSVVVRFPRLVEKAEEEQGARVKEECIYTLR
jgi:hypothetical protein